MKRGKEELGNIYVTPKGSLCKFEYFEDEITEKEFFERVTHKDNFFDDNQIFKIDVNCIYVNDFVENHPLFPMLVWEDEDIMFGFNARFISQKFGW